MSGKHDKHATRMGRALKEAGLAGADTLAAEAAALVEQAAAKPQVRPKKPIIAKVATTDALKSAEKKAVERDAGLEILEAEFGRICLDNKSYAIARDKETGKLTTQIRTGRHYVYPEGVDLFDDIVTVATVDGIAFPSGGAIVLGPANVGKTPFLRYLAQNVSDSRLIKFGEPLPGYMINDADLAVAMLNNQAPMLLIDSLKNLAGRLTGGLFGTGLSREVFYQIQDWSSYYASMGRCFVTPLNISTENAEAVSMTLEALKSNSTMVISLAADGTFTWLSRTGDGQPRSMGNGSIEWNPPSVGGIRKLRVDRVATGEDDGGLALAMGAGIERPMALAASVRRFVSQAV